MRLSKRSSIKQSRAFQGIWTQGDNSSFIDNRVVMESGFDGKVIWYANGLGAIYDFLTLKLALPLFLLGSVMLLACLLMRLKLSSDQG